jgi:transcriptional regulator with XRE-family HTH domain
MTRGGRIKQLMDENRVDAQELADAIGRNRSYIYQLLKDEIKNPSYEVMNGIAKKFNVGTEFIENGIDEEIIYYNEPDILERLPKDLQEFVSKEENTPYLIVAKQLSAYDLAKLTEREMQFLIDWLKTAIEKNNLRNV